MKRFLIKYRGPLSAGLVLFAASWIWAWYQKAQALQREQAAAIRHAESLAKGLMILLSRLDLSQPAHEAQFRRDVRAQLKLHRPMRFAVVKRGKRTIVQTGQIPPSLQTNLRTGLHASLDLQVVRLPLAPHAGPPPHHRMGPHAPMYGPSWEWSSAPPHAHPPRGSAALQLYVGIDAGLPPHALRPVLQRIALFLVLAWLAIAALVFAWSRTIRSRDLEAALEVERLELARLGEMNLAAAGLAHETKNPLGLILGLSSRLAANPDMDPRDQQTLEQIMDEADRATARLSDFINFARLSDVRLGDVSASEVVSHVAATLQPDFEEAGVQLVVEPTDLSIECDLSMMEQVLVNLLLNSLQASEPKTTTTVSLERQGATAKLTVSDQGRGISSSLLPDIFKPYVTGRASGHGLGLAIVKRIIEQHGWTMDVSSNARDGTTFTVSGLRIVEAKERQP